MLGSMMMTALAAAAIVGSKRDDGVLEMDEDGNLVPLDSRIF